MTTDPQRINLRGPQRAANHPMNGAASPCTARNVENTPESMERLQPNSLSSATKKTEYAYHAP